MKTNIYGLKDIKLGIVLFMYVAQTEDENKRIVQGALLSEQKNPFNDGTCEPESLQVLQLGELDVDNAVVVGFPAPIFCFTVSDQVTELERKRVQHLAREAALKQLKEELTAQYKNDEELIEKTKKELGIA